MSEGDTVGDSLSPRERAGVRGHDLRKIDDYRWEIPIEAKPGMRVPGRIYASEPMLEHVVTDRCQEQVMNVAFLPGIQKYSLAMPDVHWGYGAPIGGVAAIDVDDGSISPGLIGFDINCGVRLVRSDILEKDARTVLKELVGTLFHTVPCGVGSHGKIKLGAGEVRKVLAKGARWAVEQGYGTQEDLDFIESRGCIERNIPGEVSDRAIERGSDQLGTLGSGNHFLEVQVVEKIFDADAARVMGLSEGSVTLMIHSGSRGLGYQVCDDFLRILRGTPEKYGIAIPDRQLVCAPIESQEGQRYMGAMFAAANYAWANRQCLMHLARTAFERVFGKGYHALGMRLVYDIAHNIAKMETHEVNGKKKKLCVHRKGATRAFPAGHPEIPERYRAIGQPVIVPGDMGRASFVMAGLPGAMAETFGSVCHGAGRQMSRSKASRAIRSRDLLDQLQRKGIIVMAEGRSIISEEAPLAYKDVNQVVEVCEKAGLARRVARLRPMGVIKG